jgi:hypothetical protein
VRGEEGGTGGGDDERNGERVWGRKAGEGRNKKRRHTGQIIRRIYNLHSSTRPTPASVRYRVHFRVRARSRVSRLQYSRSPPDYAT